MEDEWQEESGTGSDSADDVPASRAPSSFAPPAPNVPGLPSTPTPDATRALSPSSVPWNNTPKSMLPSNDPAVQSAKASKLKVLTQAVAEATQNLKDDPYLHNGGLMTPGGTVKVPAFLTNLLNMATAPEGKDIVCYFEGHVIINDPETMEKQLLPKYYRHNRFSSFQRQLHYFGFRKLVGIGGKLKSPCIFSNTSLKGKPTAALLSIQRRTKGERSLRNQEMGEDPAWTKDHKAAKTQYLKICTEVAEAQAARRELMRMMKISFDESKPVTSSVDPLDGDHELELVQERQRQKKASSKKREPNTKLYSSFYQGQTFSPEHKGGSKTPNGSDRPGTRHQGSRNGTLASILDANTDDEDEASELSSLRGDGGSECLSDVAAKVPKGRGGQGRKKTGAQGTKRRRAQLDSSGDEGARRGRKKGTGGAASRAAPLSKRRGRNGGLINFYQDFDYTSFGSMYNNGQHAFDADSHEPISDNDVIKAIQAGGLWGEWNAHVVTSLCTTCHALTHTNYSWRLAHLSYRHLAPQLSLLCSSP
ncbi:unnamed protein product [Chrysoparadoxa australica]